MMERVLDVLETPLVVHGGGDVQQQAQVERGAHKGGRESLSRLNANHGPLGMRGNGEGKGVHVFGVSWSFLEFLGVSWKWVPLSIAPPLFNFFERFPSWNNRTP
jgi:hypothetical protein